MFPVFYSSLLKLGSPTKMLISEYKHLSSSETSIRLYIPFKVGGREKVFQIWEVET